MTPPTLRVALPTFMSKYEACESARRMLQAHGEDPSVQFLGLVILYTSWSADSPSEKDIADVLVNLPERVERHPETAHTLLRIAPPRVAAALAKGVSAPVALETLNDACLLCDEVFHGDLTFREVYLRTQGLLTRNPGVGAYLGGAIAALRKPSAPKASAGLLPSGVAPFTSGPLGTLGLLRPNTPGTGNLPVGAATMKLFEPADAGVQLQRVNGEDSNPSLKRVLGRMERETGMRALSGLPELARLGELQKRFPHFEKVIEFIRLSLALAGTGAGSTSVRIAPILLRGAPGAGKSYFAQELASTLALSYEERDLSVTSEAFVLTGMDASWKNAKSGLVFDALYHGPSANPLICLNEVDKTKESGSNNSPLTALYSLLEPANARRFKDEFIGVSMDASKVVWVLTANDGPIPEPVLSRLEVFDIPEPSFEQCRQIARSVWSDLQKTDFPQGHPFAEELPDALCDEVARMSPRLMRKALARAAGLAALEGRANLGVADITTASTSYSPAKRAPLGFLG